MNIVYNGHQREVAEQLTVAELLAADELDPRQLAVEVNLQLVPRQQHSAHRLNPGDRVEVVTLVGGG